jgi:succinate dehydrogenase / fumarate reductase membrane anchor subunit
MAIYTIGLVSYIVLNPGLSFAEWHGLFSQTWMKIATILFVLSLLFHAWIGMWTVFTDYVKPFVIRCVLNVVVQFGLAACFIWALMILWSV